MYKAGKSTAILDESVFKGRHIDRERDLTYNDLYKNAQEIFNGEQFTVIGKRHKNLGMWGVEE